MRSQTSQKAELFARALRTVVLGVFAVVASVLFAAGLSLLHPAGISAATSSTINFQARLETSTGAVAPDGTYNVSFHLFSASSAVGGTSTDTGCGTDTSCEWSEQYTYNSGAGASDARVRVVNGYLTVNLGSLTAFSGINWNQQQWLTMDIGGTVGSGTITWDGQMSPRLLLTAVPYAFQAGQLGATSGANVATLSFTAPTANDSILLPDASGTVCLQSSSACGFALTSGAGAAFLQGGNSFGAQGVLGTNDNNSLALRTNSTNRAILDTSGNLSFQQASTINVASAATGTTLTIQGGAATSGTNVGGNLLLQGGAGASTGASGSVIVKSNTNNSAAAFQVQNASNVNLFTVDTTNTAIVLGNDGTPSALTVRGGAASGTNTTGANLTFAASNGTGTGGSGDLIFQTAGPAISTPTDDGNDNTSSASATTSLTFSHTVANNANRIIVVGIGTGCTFSGTCAATISSVTYAGINLTQLGTADCSTGAGHCHVELWYLAGSTVATGANNVIITASASTTIKAGASSYYNVDPTTPFGTAATATGSNNPSTLTVTSNVNQVVVDVITSDNVINSASAGQTQRYLGSGPIASSTKPGAATSTSMGWSDGSSHYATIGAGLNPPAGTSSDSLQDRLHITAAGNVGISTASPQYTLDVTGTGRFVSASNTATAFQVQNSSNSTVLDVDTANGRVGVGTNAPATNLDVENATANNTGTYALQVKQNNATSLGAYIFVNSNSSTIDALNVQGWNGSAVVNALDVKSNGYVGIGTAAPTTNLVVTSSSSAGAPQIGINNTATGGTEWYLGSTDNSNGAGGGKFIISNTTTTSSAALAIDSSNHVSIGTTGTVSNTLTVNGTTLAATWGANAHNAFQIQDTSANALYTASTSDGTIIDNSTSDALNLLENGGFESAITGSDPGAGATGWYLGSIASIVNNSANAHTGNQYLSIASNGSTDDIQTAKTYRVVPGDTVYAEGWVNTAAGATGTGGFWWQFLDKNKANIQWDAVGGSYISAPSSWTKISGTFVVPANAYYMNMASSVRSGSSGTWLFDDVVLKIINTNSPLIVDPTVNTTAAFQVQNSSGANLLTVDTSNTAIVLGNDGTPSALTVRGGAATGTDAAGANLTFAASNGTGAGGSGDIIFQTAGKGAGASVTAGTASAVQQNAGTASLTFSYTVGAQSNRLLLVGFTTYATGAVATTGVKFNGTNMTKLSSVANSGSQAYSEVWYMVAPANVTGNVVITLTASAAIVAGAEYFYNVNQTAPLGTAVTGTGTGTLATVSLASTNSSQVIFDNFAFSANVGSWTPSQTQLWYGATNNGGGASYIAANNGTTTVTWQNSSTGEQWADVAVPINPTSTGAASDTLADRLHIAANGNIGIGVASPQDTLSIASGNVYLGNGSGDRINMSGSPTSATIYNIYGSSTETILNSPASNGDIAFKIQNTEIARFTSAGYLGLGTTAPATPLEIDSSIDNTLSIISASTATWYHPINVVNSGMASGDNAIINVGEAQSNLNSGYFGFSYSGTSGSTSNYATIGLWGKDHILNVTGAGYVGIGTTAPADTLDVSVNSSGGCSTSGCFVARFINTNTGTSTNGIVIQLGVANGSRTSGNYFVSFAGGTGNPSIAGKIQGQANGVLYTTTGADYGEYFSVADMNNMPHTGDLVTIYPGATQSVVKAADNDNALVGVVSDRTGFLGNDVVCNEADMRQCEQAYKQNHVIVGLVGQVPANVSTISGDITSGDGIVSSSLPGFGAKQIDTGRNIGQAVESTSSLTSAQFSNENCPAAERSLTDPHGLPIRCGQIMVYVNPGWSVSATDTAQLRTIAAATSSLTSQVNGMAAQLDSLRGQIPYLAQANTFSGTSSNQMVIQDAGGNALFTADTEHMVVTVASLTVSGTLSVDGHIVTSGTAPTIAAASAACSSPTISIAGTDTTGTIMVTTGTQCTDAGQLATIAFNQPYAAAPQVELTAVNAAAALLPIYRTTSTTGFTLSIAGKPAATTTYIYSYFTAQ